MDSNSIVTIINSVGFPIVCCIALFWKINKQDEQHKEEITTVSSVVQQNTDAVNRLLDHLEGGNNHA